MPIGEALEAELSLAFAELSLHRMMVGYMPRHVRSEVRLKRQVLARAYLRIAGRW